MTESTAYNKLVSGSLRSLRPKSFLCLDFRCQSTVRRHKLQKRI